MDENSMQSRRREPAIISLIVSFSDIDSLALYAGIHRKVLGYFRLLSKRFPYAIYYQMESDAVTVWRVLDCRRDPAWIRKQLKT